MEDVGMARMTMWKRLENGLTRVAVKAARRRRGRKAVAFLRRQHKIGSWQCPHKIAWRMHCAHTVACAYGRAFSGWDAYAGWEATVERYRRDGRKKDKPPRGAFVFYRGKTAREYGHVALANGRGMVWGNDAPVLGKVGLVPVRYPESQWGYTLVGWVWPDEVAGW